MLTDVLPLLLELRCLGLGASGARQEPGGISPKVKGKRRPRGLGEDAWAGAFYS